MQKKKILLNWHKSHTSICYVCTVCMLIHNPNVCVYIFAFMSLMFRQIVILFPEAKEATLVWHVGSKLFPTRLPSED